MGNFAGWNKNVPSGSSLLRQGDDIIRSDKSILEATLNEEHYFEAGSPTSTGVHRLGSARVFVGPRSDVSAAADEGRLMFASDTSTLHMLTPTSHETVGWPLSALTARFIDSGDHSDKELELSNLTVHGTLEVDGACVIDGPVVALSDGSDGAYKGSSLTIDLSTARNHIRFSGAATNVAFINGQPGAVYVLESAGFFVTFRPGAVRWPGGSAVSFPNGSHCLATIFYSGVTYYGSIAGFDY